MHRLLKTVYFNAAVKDLDRERYSGWLLYCTCRSQPFCCLCYLSPFIWGRCVCSWGSSRFYEWWYFAHNSHDFATFFFFFPRAPAAAATLFLFTILIYWIKSANNNTDHQVFFHHFFFSLFQCFLLAKRASLDTKEISCYSSAVCAHCSNSHSCDSSPQDSHQERKKTLEKHWGLFWSWPLLAVRQLLSLLNRKQQQQSAENEVACIHHTRSIYKSVYRCRTDTIRVIIYVIYCASALINIASNASFVFFAIKVDRKLV